MIFPEPTNTKQILRAVGVFPGFRAMNTEGWHPLDGDAFQCAELDSRRSEWSAVTGREMIVSRTEQLRKLALGATVRWPIDQAATHAIRGMLGDGPQAYNDLASNLTLRKVTAEAWAAKAEQVASKNPGLTFYLGTIFDDKVRTSDRHTVIDLEPFKKRVRKILAEAGIRDWTAIIEFEGETNSVRGAGRPIIPHAHILFWTRDVFHPQITGDALCNSGRLSSSTGAKTVDFTSRAGPSSVAYTCFYMLKPPKGANLMASTKEPGSWVRREAVLRPDHALRIVEALSHFRLESLIMSGGTGKRFRRHMVASMIHFRDSPTVSRPITVADVPRIWQEARTRAGRDKYGAVRILS
jgi:hypothetical protein